MQKKRFYKTVSLKKEPDGIALLLDNKPVKTMAGAVLLAPNKAIATMVQTEWAAQDTHIVPDTMPLTQILNTKIDRVAKQRPAMETAILKYLDTDLISYRTPHPPELGKQQAEIWDKWIDWTEKTFGYRLKTTEGLTALSQLAALHEKIKSHVTSLSEDEFTILQLITSLSGSLILALAFAKSDLSVEGLYKAIRVEENYKAKIYDEEKYGPDPAQEEKEKALLRDLEAAHAYIKTL